MKILFKEVYKKIDEKGNYEKIADNIVMLEDTVDSLVRSRAIKIKKKDNSWIVYYNI